MIALELSMRGLLRNFGLKVGAISRGKYEYRIRELVDGNLMLQAATWPMLRARATLRQELAGLERLVRRMAKEDPCMSSAHVNARSRSGCRTKLPVRH